MPCFKTVLWGGAAAAALTAFPCAAQQANPPDARTSGAAQLEEIVVTAQRRVERLQDVPVAVTAITADAIVDRQITEASQLTQLAPSLQQQTVNNQVGAINFSIRGVGTAVYGVQIEPSVATVIDDVVLARPTMGAVKLFDLDRVEVLRGPQGMLFGKNASAGLINIVTARPRLGEFSALANVSTDVRDTDYHGMDTEIQGAVNIPVTANSALRVSGFATRQDGYVKNVFRDEDLGLREYGFRAKYLWVPNDSLEVYLAGDYAHEKGPADSGTIRRFDAPGGFIQSRDTLAGVTASPMNTLIASNGTTTNVFDVSGVQANITYHIGNGFSIQNIAAYRKIAQRSTLDTDLLPDSLSDIDIQSANMWQLSNELRLTSPSRDRLEYQLGLYYLKFHGFAQGELGINLSPFLPPAPPGRVYAAAVFPSGAHSRSYAIYAEGKYKLTQNLRLLAGGRFTYDTLSYFNSLDNLGILPIFTTNRFSSGLSNKNFSYRVGLQYEFGPEATAYVTYARGYKGPTFGQGNRVGPEIPTSVEMGLKSTTLNNRLNVNVDVFHTDFKGYQAQTAIPGEIRFLTQNAGNLVSEGIEVDFRAVPVAGLTLSGGALYNHTRYEQYLGVPCYIGAPVAPSGTNVCLPIGSIDVSGDTLAFAPAVTANASARYERQMSAGLKGFIQADYYFRSKTRYTAAEDPQTRVGAFGVVGASIGLESSDSRYRVSIFGRNLTDVRVPNFILADPTSAIYRDDKRGGNYLQQLGPDSFRTIGIAFDYHM